VLFRSIPDEPGLTPQTGKGYLAAVRSMPARPEEPLPLMTTRQIIGKMITVCIYVLSIEMIANLCLHKYETPEEVHAPWIPSGLVRGLPPQLDCHIYTAPGRHTRTDPKLCKQE